MDKFKLPEGWDKIPFSKAVKRTQSSGGKLKTKDYESQGLLPVVDQGQALIVAFTNKLEYKFQGPYPVIVFGDHTKNVKYIDFPFAVGADGVVLLRPVPKILPKYLYYWLQQVPIHNLGYSRHYKLLSDLEIPVPPLAEQLRIVARIEELTRSVEEARKLLSDAQTELATFVPALLAKAFRGEL